MGRFVGRQLWKHKAPIAGAALIGAAIAPQMSHDVGRAQQGLTHEWLEASNAGAVPDVPPGENLRYPNVPTPTFNGFKNLL